MGSEGLSSRGRPRASLLSTTEEVTAISWCHCYGATPAGRPFRGTLYPPRAVLYRTSWAHYEDDGHGHRVKVDGEVKDLPARLDHDDRKPLSRWFRNQISYASLEAEKLLSTPRSNLGRNDRIRRTAWLAPMLILPYCLIVKRGLLDGRVGWFYALQRLMAEIMLALELISRRLTPQREPGGPPGR